MGFIKMITKINISLIIISISIFVIGLFYKNFMLSSLGFIGIIQFSLIFIIFGYNYKEVLKCLRG